MHTPDSKLRGKVEALAAYGMPHKLIAKAIGVSINTLRKYYREELDEGLPKANSQMAQTIWKEGMGLGKSGRVNIRAAIYWMNARAGWSENGPAEQEPTSSGAPSSEAVAGADDYDFSGKSIDEVKALKAQLEEAKAAARAKGKKT